MNKVNYLLIENRKIYAQLMSIKEQRKQLQAKMDLEIALSGVELYNHNEIPEKQTFKVCDLFIKIACLYEREIILKKWFNDNLTAIKEQRKNGK